MTSKSLSSAFIPIIKKTSIPRKTEQYFKKKLLAINTVYEAFCERDARINALNDENNENQPYFTENTFGQLRARKVTSSS